MTTIDPAAPALDCLDVANRLRPVILHINRHLRREVHALGVTGGQVSVLASLRDNPGIGIGDLAARERMSAPSMSNHIDRLEASGMVTRQRADADRRRVGLFITAEGQGVLRAVRSRRTAWLAHRLATLAPEQIAAVDAAIDALSALVEEV